MLKKRYVHHIWSTRESTLLRLSKSKIHRYHFNILSSSHLFYYFISFSKTDNISRQTISKSNNNFKLKKNEYFLTNFPQFGETFFEKHIIETDINNFQDKKYIYIYIFMLERNNNIILSTRISFSLEISFENSRQWPSIGILLKRKSNARILAQQSGEWAKHRYRATTTF